MLKKLEFFDYYDTAESNTLKVLSYFQTGFCKELQVRTIAPKEALPTQTSICKMRHSNQYRLAIDHVFESLYRLG